MTNLRWAAWLEAHDAMLLDLRRQGYSGSQIAKALNREFKTSYTRSAICGRVHRLGLSRPVVAKAVNSIRAADAPRREGGRRSLKTKAATKVVVAGNGSTFKTPLHCEPLPEWTGELTPLAVDLMSTDAHGCKWPIGDGPIGFCNRPRDMAPYCRVHSARAWVPNTKPKRNPMRPVHVRTDAGNWV